MDSSILDEQILMDDSFLLPKMNDDEVTQILKKWSSNNPPPKKDISNHNETFDSRTYTRPKRKTFNLSDVEKDLPSVESGIASINLQVGGQMSSLPASAFMQRSWLNDVSPPSSICTSMDFQNNDHQMLNSLITSSDFTNVSFLLNGGNDRADVTRNINATITIDNVTPTQNFTRNLMDFTFDVPNAVIKNNTFNADVESPLKEFGFENIELQLNESIENLDKNLTYNAHNGANITWERIQEHENQLNRTIVQSTPVHNQDGVLGRNFDHGMSPISSLRAAIEDEESEVVIRNLKSRNLVNDITIEDYRNSMEDQCEFLLNEETIKLGEKLGVCNGDTFECLDLKTALIQSTDAGEKFDEMLDNFSVKKSLESEKLLQSVDTIKQRHSLINFEKQREEKLKNETGDNKSQYDTMTKSNERLLRRSRLYDDVNIQLQKQQMESVNVEEDEIIPDKKVDNSRDRFKTIKLNKRLQSGMVVVDVEPTQEKDESTSPGTNKERRNQINQQKQDVEFKKPTSIGVSKLSKFGFSRPAYRSRNDLNLPLKANSTDSLDEDQPVKNVVKSPMGVKSKSIHNLIMGGNSGRELQKASGLGSYSNLRLLPGAARSQSNLKAPRASSLVRPFNEAKEATASLKNSPSTKMRAPATSNRIRPSSGYYGRRIDSDNESGCSLSSSSASSRNSVHLTNVDQQASTRNQNTLQSSEELNHAPRNTGAIPKPSGLRAPSNLRAPQIRSGLPRPSAMPIRR